MNFFLIKSLYFLGTIVKFENKQNIPEGIPLIIVANDQGLIDIPPIVWYLRKYHPKFISKKELGKGIPSVSFNLRHGGSVLIDRKDSRQSLSAIRDFAKKIHEKKWSAVIFPEGTRGKKGKPKEFQVSGLKILFKNIPDGLVIPITINNSWKVQRYGKFPYGIFNTITFKVQEPMKVSDYNPEELINKTELAVKKDIVVENG